MRRTPLVAMACASAAIVLMLASDAPAQSTNPSYYTLQAGDALDIRVAGLPSLDRILTIEASGEISLPLGGRIVAVGLTLPEAERLIAERMASQVYRQRGAEGGESLFEVATSEIAVAIDSYVPVFVGGDVQQPGSYDYQPGLTARRAMVLAGGPDDTQADLDRDPTIQIMQLRTRERGYRAQLDALDARIDRLSQDVRPPTAKASDTGTPQLAFLDAELLSAEHAAMEMEKAFLESSLAAYQEEIALLEDRLDVQSQSVMANQEEYDRVLHLLERGLVSSTQSTAAEHALLSSTSNRLETERDLVQRRQDVTRTRADLAALPAEFRLDRLDALTDALARRSETQALLAGVRDELQALGAPTTGTLEEDIVTMRISRTNGEVIELGPSSDSPVLPGDLIEVSIRAIVPSN